MEGQDFNLTSVGIVEYNVCQRGSFAMLSFANKSTGITPTHPVLVDNAWQFPKDMYEQPGQKIFGGPLTDSHVCDVVLRKEGQRQHHYFTVEGILAIAMGHGLGTPDILQHDFLQHHDLVIKSLSKGHVDENGKVYITGTRRDKLEGSDHLLISGFTFPNVAMVQV